MKEVRYMQSKWLYGFGLVKHLIEELNLTRNTHVLNLGCGFGKTAEYITQRFACSTTAADISKKVIEKAEKRDLKTQYGSRINFKVLDSLNPIFEEKAFEAIIIETLTTFMKDKMGAAKAFAKALKPLGRMGMLELVWLKPKNPPTVVNEIELRFGIQANPLSDEEWRSLFSRAGLQLLKSRIYHLSLLRKTWDDFRFDFFESSSELLKTIKTIIAVPTAQRITADFIGLQIRYAKFLGIAKYIFIKPISNNQSEIGDR